MVRTKYKTQYFALCFGLVCECSQRPGGISTSGAGFIVVMSHLMDLCGSSELNLGPLQYLSSTA